MAQQSNTNEGADPSGDIKKQNLGGTTTEDLTQGTGQSRAGTGEGADADADGNAKDENEQSEPNTKTQDLVKAGRDDLDPNAGQE
ncbi:hypothetical protein [Sphingomonas phyllosphaerae]|uniref:hypothetical protein n=1 Tax=Sphingomonas phyllosphaerae TaxID=257003 RepID=UPI0012DE3E59|nr:hypothetical protein [Sphingomonas phyllosphaerae]